MKTGIELIAEERQKYKTRNGMVKINYQRKTIADDLLVIQKGVKFAIFKDDPRLLELLVKAGALIAAEIDRLQAEFILEVKNQI